MIQHVWTSTHSCSFFNLVATRHICFKKTTCCNFSIVTLAATSTLRSLSKLLVDHLFSSPEISWHPEAADLSCQFLPWDLLIPQFQWVAQVPEAKSCLETSMLQNQRNYQNHKKIPQIQPRSCDVVWLCCVESHCKDPSALRSPPSACRSPNVKNLMSNSNRDMCQVSRPPRHLPCRLDLPFKNWSNHLRPKKNGCSLASEGMKRSKRKSLTQCLGVSGVGFFSLLHRRSGYIFSKMSWICNQSRKRKKQIS